MILTDHESLKNCPSEELNKTILLDKQEILRNHYYLDLGLYLPTPYNQKDFIFYIHRMKKNKPYNSELKRFLYSGNEWCLLEFLRNNADQLHDYEKIIEVLNLKDKTSLKMMVYRIRKIIKREAPDYSKNLLTVRKRGYIWLSS